MSKRKMTLSERLNRRKIRLPDPVLYDIAYAAVRFWYKLRFNPKYVYHFDKRSMKGKQVILLADHASYSAFWYVFSGYHLSRFNVVTGWNQIFRKFRFELLMRFGIIPKRHFTTDLHAMRQILQIIKMGGSIALFPEGTYSFSGSNGPINPSTIGMLKRLALPVVLCKTYGGFLAHPVYKNKSVRGRQEYHYELLFTPEEIRNSSKETMFQKLIERFRYNDFEWNLKEKNTYHWRNSNTGNIEMILYRCPKCGAEHQLHGEKNLIICGHCGNTVTMDESYALAPRSSGDVCPYRHIDEWFKDQRRIVGEAVQNPDFSVTYPCELIRLHNDRVRFDPYEFTGEGVLTLSRAGIRYVGTQKGEAITFVLPVKQIPGFRFDAKIGNMCSYHNEYFFFRPKQDLYKGTQYMLIVEELNRLENAAWRAASRDCL